MLAWAGCVSDFTAAWAGTDGRGAWLAAGFERRRARAGWAPLGIKKIAVFMRAECNLGLG